jgi:hypothetical protein
MMPAELRILSMFVGGRVRVRRIEMEMSQQIRGAHIGLTNKSKARSRILAGWEPRDSGATNCKLSSRYSSFT